jgi:WD40 repeat protein
MGPLLAVALFAEAGQDQPAAKDLSGDPLPAGAVARLGTLRFRHDAVISFAAFLPGGKSVLSVSNDGIACVWEFPSGKQLRRFSTRAADRPLPASDDDLLLGLPPSLRAGVPTRAAALSPDGKTLATSFSASASPASLLGGGLPAKAKGGKKTSPTKQQTDIRLHDVATGKERAAWKVDAAIVPELAFSPDGKHLTVWGNDGFARIWDWANAKEVGKAATVGAGAAAGAGGLAYSPDGKTLMLSGSSRVLQFVEVPTGKEVGPHPGSTDPLTAVWFTPDGKHVLTQARGSLTTRGLSSRALGSLLTQAALSTRKWDAATGRDLGTVKPPASPGNPTVISPDGRFGVTVATFLKPADARGANARPAVLFDTASGKELGEIALEVEVTPVHRKPLAFSPDGKMLAVNSGTEAEKIDLYEVPGGKRLRTLDAGPVANPQGRGGFGPLGRFSQQMRFSPDGKVLAFHPGDAASPIVLLDTATGRRLGSLVPAPNNVLTTLLAFSPDGRCLALDMGDGTVALLELATGQPRRTYGKKLPPQPELIGRGPGGLIGGVGGGPGGPIALFGGAAADPGRCLAISPGGRKLALAGTDGALLVLDILTGQELAVFKGHTGTVNAVAFAPDGKTVASASSDATALLWNVTRLKRAAAPVKAPQPGDLDAWWQTLAGKDASRAFAAMADFAAAPQDAVAFLKDRLKPAAAIDGNRIAESIGRLDDAQYKVREKATSDLLQIGEQAVPALDKALAANPSRETRKRLEFLRDQLTGRLLQGERLRAYRAVEVLEIIGTPQAREVLQALAAGAPGSLVTTSARAALRR